MTLLAVGALALAVVLAGWRWGGLGRAGALPLAAAATLGAAGYAWSGAPGVPGRLMSAGAERVDEAADLFALRDRLGSGDFGVARNWIVFSDGQARRGRTELALAILKRGLRDAPKSTDLRVARAFALIAHADGAITPAAELAMDEVRALDSASPAPDFLAGEEAARADRLEEARAIWTRLLARAPADARWRDDVAVRLELLRRIEQNRSAR